MHKVRFDPSLDTVRVIERNNFDKWWKKDEIPFAQLRAKVARRETLTAEELEELQAYRNEVKARTTGKKKTPEGTRQRNVRTLREIRDLLQSANLDPQSRQRLLDVRDKVMESIKSRKSPK